jgi:hypothetical protein
MLNDLLSRRQSRVGIVVRKSGIALPVRQTVDGADHAYLRSYPRSTPEL